MPMPKPSKKEEKKKYIARCMRFLVKEGRKVEQAAAICYDNYLGAKIF